MDRLCNSMLVFACNGICCIDLPIPGHPCLPSPSVSIGLVNEYDIPAACSEYFVGLFRNNSISLFFFVLRFYLMKFEDYPKNRKAFIPFVW